MQKPLPDWVFKRWNQSDLKPYMLDVPSLRATVGEVTLGKTSGKDLLTLEMLIALEFFNWK